MLNTQALKIYFYTQPIDMRKSIDGLCMIVSEILKMNPTQGYCFLFRNRHGNKLKILYYETNCFTLWYRRLEKGRFVFQKHASDTMEMSQAHFTWLLASDKYSRRDTLEAKDYSHFY